MEGGATLEQIQIIPIIIITHTIAITAAALAEAVVVTIIHIMVVDIAKVSVEEAAAAVVGDITIITTIPISIQHTIRNVN